MFRMSSSSSDKSKPMIRAKPKSLRGSPISPRLDADFLSSNLLGDNEPESHPLLLKVQEATQQPKSASTDGSVGSLHRLVIAIDYGTTFTGVAIATPKGHEANFDVIHLMTDWGKGMSNRDKVPSVYSYSLAPNDEQQWGDSLSPEAVTMINTKLELDVQDNKSDELELILQVLEGMNNLHFDHVRACKGYPEYTWKDPEEIVTDYMNKIYHYVDQYVDKFRVLGLPVDIVITVPVGWSYRAKNSTLRAIKTAGFNEENFPNLQDIVMVTEPEAAAIYTARYLKTEMGKDFLKIGECFVLCDAGGGTVDVVSYRVTRLEPALELERIGNPYSDKCGSVYIDLEFKKWLCEVLGDRYYIKLDPKSQGNGINTISEGSRMRHIIRQFEVYKKKFTVNSPPAKIDLPEPLRDITVHGRVNQGELTITNAEMISFFDRCVDRVIQLYQGQLQQIERQRGRRLKNVFLIGGFGESPYLQSELRKALSFRKVELRRPDTSWSAVVRGAVMHGIEKVNRPNVIFMNTCPSSYGIVLDETFSGSRFRSEDRHKDSVTGEYTAKGQITWLIKKGDLILSDEGRTSEKEFRATFQGSREIRERKKLTIYEYEDDDLPDRFRNAREELKEVTTLTYDLSRFSIDDFDRSENQNTRESFYIAYLTCKMTMSGATVTVEILWNDEKLCKAKIKDVGRKGSVRSWS